MVVMSRLTDAAQALGKHYFLAVVSIGMESIGMPVIPLDDDIDKAVRKLVSFSRYTQMSDYYVIEPDEEDHTKAKILYESGNYPQFWDLEFGKRPRPSTPSPVLSAFLGLTAAVEGEVSNA